MIVDNYSNKGSKRNRINNWVTLSISSKLFQKLGEVTYYWLLDQKTGFNPRKGVHWKLSQVSKDSGDWAIGRSSWGLRWII